MADVIGESTEHMRVSAPASAQFADIPRTATSGIALRIGFEVAAIERLRALVDLGTEALGGKGDLEVMLDWTDDVLAVTLNNPNQSVSADMRQQLADLAQTNRIECNVERHRVTLTLRS